MHAPEPSIAFEMTPGLVALRQSIGDATRSLNGIMVALETLRHAETPIKPADLVLAWHKSDDPEDIDNARAFAMKSAMVTVIDAVDHYMRVTSRVGGLTPKNLDDTLNGRRDPKLGRRPTIAERLRSLATHVSGAVNQNHLLAFDLLATWRNEFVHRDKRFPVPKSTLTALKKAAMWFTQARGGADIVSLVARYERSESPTLPDLATLFASAQRAVADIDERLLLAQKGPEYSIALMKYLLQTDPDPAAMLERVFEHGGSQSSGVVHALFLANGGNHDEKRRASAPSMTRKQLDTKLGIGRNTASQLFEIPRPNSP